jgi:hypothetical protein
VFASVTWISLRLAEVNTKFGPTGEIILLGAIGFGLGLCILFLGDFISAQFDKIKPKSDDMTLQSFHENGAILQLRAEEALKLNAEKIGEVKEEIQLLNDKENKHEQENKKLDELKQELVELVKNKELHTEELDRLKTYNDSVRVAST